MGLEKIHMPDCSKAFEIAKTCGCVIGNCIGTVAVWLGAGIAVICVFIACLVGLAMWGVVKALPVALLAVGRFAKDVIGGADGESSVGHPSVPLGIFGGRGTPRAA